MIVINSRFSLAGSQVYPDLPHIDISPAPECAAACTHRHWEIHPSCPRPPPQITFCLSVFIVFFFSLHLHKSRTCDRTYEEENEKYDYMNGQISVQNVHIPSLIGCICRRLGNEFANSDRRCSNR